MVFITFGGNFRVSLPCFQPFTVPRRCHHPSTIRSFIAVVTWRGHHSAQANAPFPGRTPPSQPYPLPKSGTTGNHWKPLETNVNHTSKPDPNPIPIPNPISKISVWQLSVCFQPITDLSITDFRLPPGRGGNEKLCQRTCRNRLILDKKHSSTTPPHLGV